MKKLLILLLSITTSLAIAGPSEMYSKLHSLEQFYETLELEKDYDEHLKEYNKSYYSIANINVFLMGAKVGLGKLEIDTNTGDEIKKLTLDLKVKILGIDLDRIKQSLSISDLLRGKELEFYMQGNPDPTLKIKAQRSFTKKGGNILIRYLTSQGWKSMTAEIDLNGRTGKYATYNTSNSSRINGLNVNLKGWRISTLKVKSVEIL
jgi:hypothetical protein